MILSRGVHVHRPQRSEFPGRYLISGALSRVPEDLHKFVLLVPEYAEVVLLVPECDRPMCLIGILYMIKVINTCTGVEPAK